MNTSFLLFAAATVPAVLAGTAVVSDFKCDCCGTLCPDVTTIAKVTECAAKVPGSCQFTYKMEVSLKEATACESFELSDKAKSAFAFNLNEVTSDTSLTAYLSKLKKLTISNIEGFGSLETTCEPKVYSTGLTETDKKCEIFETVDSNIERVKSVTTANTAVYTFTDGVDATKPAVKFASENDDTCKLFKVVEGKTVALSLTGDFTGTGTLGASDSSTEFADSSTDPSTDPSTVPSTTKAASGVAPQHVGVAVVLASLVSFSF